MIRTWIARAEWSVDVLMLALLCGMFLPLERFRNPGRLELGEVDTANRVVMTVLLAYSVVMIVAHRRRALPALAQAWLVLLLLLLAYFSALWSVAPDATLRRAASLTGITLFGVYLAARWRPVELGRMLVVAGALMVAASYALLALNPTLATMQGGALEGAVRGAFAHKNVLGSTMSLVMIACVWTLAARRRRRLALATLAGALPLWVLANSMTAILALAATILVTVSAQGLRGGAVRRLAWSYILIAGGVVVLGVVAAEGASLLQLVGRDATLTGRAPLWGMLMRAVAERPIAGFGYQAFWIPEAGLAEQVAAGVGWTVPTAHNGWIEVLLSLGVVGLVPIAALVFVTLWRALAATASGLLPGAALMLGLGVYFLVVSVFELNLMMPGGVGWTLLVAMWVATARHARVRRRARMRRGILPWRFGPASPRPDWVAAAN